jgi:hypothetical protein
MKTLIIALAAAAALASPALAHPGMHMQRGNDAHAARAQAMPPADADTVYAFGANLGSDPDPQVRLQFLRGVGMFDR